MKKSIFCVCFSLLCLFSVCLAGCDKSETPAQSHKMVVINNVNYGSLTEAVAAAKDNDTLRIYDDLNEHKNVVITKPLKIEGVLAASKVRPKFYGSITIDARGKEDQVEIVHLDIVHDGQHDEAQENDTAHGINIVDGGVSLKYCFVGHADQPVAEDAAGVVVSRRVGSQNIMPIEIKGNSFDNYEKSAQLSAALVVKRGGEFQNLAIDEEQLYSENVFDHESEGVMFASLNAAGDCYSYLVTSSSDVLLSTLLKGQDPSGSHFLLIASSPLSQAYDKPVSILKTTSVKIEGGKGASFAGQELTLYGKLNVDSKVTDLTITRGSSEAGLVFTKPLEESITIK